VAFIPDPSLPLQVVEPSLLRAVVEHTTLNPVEQLATATTSTTEISSSSVNLPGAVDAEIQVSTLKKPCNGCWFKLFGRGFHRSLGTEWFNTFVGLGGAVSCASPLDDVIEAGMASATGDPAHGA